MVLQCQQSGQLWVDKVGIIFILLNIQEFPADKKSLFRNPNKIPDFAKDIK